MSEHRGHTVRVGDALASFLNATDKTGRLAKERASMVWPEVVGPEIAGHTLGIGLNKGMLNVHVDSHAWATELGLLAEELRSRLNSVLGEEEVTAIRFTVSRRVSDSHGEALAERAAQRRYGGQRVQPVALTQAEHDVIEAETAGIENAELRETAIQARVRDQEVKKARRAKGSNGKEDEGAQGADKPESP